MNITEVQTVLRQGGVAIARTDTLYGVLGSALREDVVEKIYRLRQRDLHKPLIVLLADMESVRQFGVELSEFGRRYLQSVWPGPTSVILDVRGDQYAYLHRGTHSIAFRVPNKDDLRELLRTVGPLVAPSANPQGEPPAQTIEEARAYFGDAVDIYVDEGAANAPASRLVRLKDDQIEILRK